MPREQRASVDPNDRLAGGREIFVSGAVALTEPGPAAFGIVVVDDQGRTLARRAQYVGRATRTEAAAQGLLAALRMAVNSGLVAPTFRIDERPLVDALVGKQSLSASAAPLAAAIQDLLQELPGHRLESVGPAANPARAVALEPLVDWLPERTRRAEDLTVRRAGGHVYEVESESHPGQVYRVTVPDGEGGALECECSDFQYRGIPCKHLLAVARAAGLLDRVFHIQRPESPSPTAHRRE